MKPRMIDWEETGSVLQNLRQGNLNLRRNVCRELRLDLGECAGNCDICTKEMDRSISRNELAKVFCVSENMVTNWEKGTTPVRIEELLFYCELTGLALTDLLVFAD